MRQARANSASQAGQLRAQTVDLDGERLAAEIDEALRPCSPRSIGE